VAGRFITKCEMVWGIVMVLGGGGGFAGFGVRGFFVSMVILFCFVAWSWRRSSAVDLMKMCPSWLNGRTNFETWIVVS